MNQDEYITNRGEGSMSSFSGTGTTSTTSSKQIHNNPLMVAGTKLLDNDEVSHSLVYNLSTLQDKVHQIQSLVSFYMISNQSSGSTSLAMANMGSLVQEIITSASSMLFTCQQLNNSSIRNNNDINNDQTADATVMEFSRVQDHDYMQDPTNLFGVQERGHNSFPDQNINWYETQTLNPKKKYDRSESRSGNYEILELDATDLLAKFTHYCQICGKGFKRDANLRMHMRAHGDEYKTREALISPTSQEKKGEYELKKHYYSCPQQGCRWNQKHEKFQPLKSVICAKNHYKRSHCPKMYMCRRCSVKHFSVLSDLRTHEKHCGDIKWVCSCGTKFSRKDKLMSHVALFFGHVPAHWSS